MSLVINPNVSREINFETKLMEEIILKLSDLFDIRLIDKYSTGILTGASALVGGLVGGLAGGKVGAVVAAGIGGAAGYGLSTTVSLRTIWDYVKEDLKELIYIVFNFLRRLHPDYVRAVKILMRCAASRMELGTAILEFIAYKLCCTVFSNISEAHHQRMLL